MRRYEQPKRELDNAWQGSAIVARDISSNGNPGQQQWAWDDSGSRQFVPNPSKGGIDALPYLPRDIGSSDNIIPGSALANTHADEDARAAPYQPLNAAGLTIKGGPQSASQEVEGTHLQAHSLAPAQVWQGDQWFEGDYFSPRASEQEAKYIDSTRKIGGGAGSDLHNESQNSMSELSPLSTSSLAVNGEPIRNDLVRGERLPDPSEQNIREPHAMAEQSEKNMTFGKPSYEESPRQFQVGDVARDSHSQEQQHSPHEWHHDPWKQQSVWGQEQQREDIPTPQQPARLPNASPESGGEGIDASPVAARSETGDEKAGSDGSHPPTDYGFPQHVGQSQSQLQSPEHSPSRPESRETAASAAEKPAATAAETPPRHGFPGEPIPETYSDDRSLVQRLPPVIGHQEMPAQPTQERIPEPLNAAIMNPDRSGFQHVIGSQIQQQGAKQQREESSLLLRYGPSVEGLGPQQEDAGHIVKEVASQPEVRSDAGIDPQSTNWNQNSNVHEANLYSDQPFDHFLNTVNFVAKPSRIAVPLIATGQRSWHWTTTTHGGISNSTMNETFLIRSNAVPFTNRSLDIDDAFADQEKINFTEAELAAHMKDWNVDDRTWLFHMLDDDRDAYITSDNLRRNSPLLTKEQINGIIRDMDQDKDGKISYQEFDDGQYQIRIGSP